MDGFTSIPGHNYDPNEPTQPPPPTLNVSGFVPFHIPLHSDDVEHEGEDHDTDTTQDPDGEDHGTDAPQAPAQRVLDSQEVETIGMYVCLLIYVIKSFVYVVYNKRF